MSQELVRYVAYAALNVMIAKEFNAVVTEPYMDEPFHIPQAQAYCRGEWDVWDPKLTTPPGLYILSVLFKRLFLFKCNLPVLRFTNVLLSIILPPIITSLLARIRRQRAPESLLEPTTEALVLSLFPIAWFFGFLYYTEMGSLVLVLLCLQLSLKERQWAAAGAGLLSCTFRQTNVIWMIYAMGAGALRTLHYQTVSTTTNHRILYDPPARSTSRFDLVRCFVSLPNAVYSVMGTFIPYVSVCVLFVSFVIWNGGVVLGDKSNHIPTLHIPQLYYFLAFTTLFGFPVLLSGPGGIGWLAKEVRRCMFSTTRRVVANVVLTGVIALTVELFTIHHPFILSDNRHYTFYIWKLLFRRNQVLPLLLSPLYVLCGYLWFVRIYSPPRTSRTPPAPTPMRSSGNGNGHVEIAPVEERPMEQQQRILGPPTRPPSSTLPSTKSLLHSMLLPICLIPALLPTPLLEPRYFLIPYFLLRLQIDDTTVGGGDSSGNGWGVIAEGVWYALINWATMSIFLYREREGVGRFMW